MSNNDRNHSSNRRQYSQNFLIDEEAIDLVIATAAPRGLVLEPGGGAGALTRKLVRHATVHSYEIDPHYAQMLERVVPSARIIRGDFAQARVPQQPFQVVGNIPFSATTRIIDWCLAAPTLRSATLLTQLEVARKRTGGYGRWTRTTALSWPTHTWWFKGTVPARAFRPVPRVDSGILRIERRLAPVLSPRERAMHHRIVSVAFLGAGGCVGASLNREFDRQRVGRALGAAGIAHSALVSSVDPRSWLDVARALSV